MMDIAIYHDDASHSTSLTSFVNSINSFLLDGDEQDKVLTS